MVGDQKTFKGYGITTDDPSKWNNFELITYPSKRFEETDIEVAISHCGVCGSDVHTLTQGWGEIQLPLVVGHEICGKAVRVGSQVKGIKVGDTVGVGAQIASCYQCKACKSDHENYCPGMIDTYGQEYPDGVHTMGGYSTGVIANERFCFKIPDGLEPKYACSMLCAGLTVYSPLLRNGVTKGSKVAVVGIGGLGHYAILFAKAMGAEVHAFTHSKSKTEDVKKMGADFVVDTAEESSFAKTMPRLFDVIMFTRDVSEDFPIGNYLKMLSVHGQFVVAGLPDHLLPPVDAFDLLKNGCAIAGSHLGNKHEALQMLQLAADKNIVPWIEELPMKEVKQAVDGVKSGKVRYRYVLVQDIDA